MASGALFGNSSGRSQSKNLVEFKAGKMTLKDKMVNPDKRKGLIYIHQTDDSLMHFCWKDRNSGVLEDDLIIFPDDVEYKHVAQCTTGRVYILKFKSSNRKFFFWMQEPKADKDEEYCRKVNDYLNNPPTPGSNRGSGSSSGLPSELSGLGDTDLQNILGNMSQQQLMQLLGGMGGLGNMSGLGSLLSSSSRPTSAQTTTSSTPPVRRPLRVQSGTTGNGTVTQATRPTTTITTTTTSITEITPTTTVTTAPTATSGSRQQIQLSDLQSILSGISLPQAPAATESEEQAEGGQGKPTIDLSSALTAEILTPILTNSSIQEQLAPFLPFVENQTKSNEELNSTVRSPQFQQALSMFSLALQSGQLAPVIRQMDLGEDAINAATLGDMEAFVCALQKRQKGDGADETGDKPTPRNEDKDDDEGMSLD